MSKRGGCSGLASGATAPFLATSKRGLKPPPPKELVRTIATEFLGFRLLKRRFGFTWATEEAMRIAGDLFQGFLEILFGFGELFGEGVDLFGDVGEFFFGGGAAVPSLLAAM